MIAWEEGIKITIEVKRAQQFNSDIELHLKFVR